jgi:hypothetical protein
MPSCGVGSNQHKMIDFSRRVFKPDRDMHGKGPVCGHETVSGPAGGGDLGSSRLVTEVGGCGGWHTDRILLEQRVEITDIIGLYLARRRTRPRSAWIESLKLGVQSPTNETGGKALSAARTRDAGRAKAAP